MAQRESVGKRGQPRKRRHRLGRLAVGEPFSGAGARVDVKAVAEGQLIEAVIERAVEVIGDRPQAMRWLGTPVRALNYATPISRLHGPQGHADVLRILMQLEHGVL
jgi:hypothetical protein